MHAKPKVQYKGNHNVQLHAEWSGLGQMEKFQLGAPAAPAEGSGGDFESGYVPSALHITSSGGNQQGRSAGAEIADKHQVSVPQKRGWKTLAAYIGPGYLVCIAYLDPANFETDLQAGALYRFELLWVVLVASISALVIQALAAKLGVVTRKHLAEHCRAEYPRHLNLALWVLAEVTIVASDVPEVIGTAFALNILFKVPVWAGVLLTGFSTLILLGLQHYGVRKLEFLIAFLVFTMAACFFMEIGYAKPSAGGVLKGMFVPELKGSGAAGLAVSLLGALVMPHNLFLHSALVLTRQTPYTDSGIRDGCKYYLWESAFALLVSFLINVSVVSVSGGICGSQNLSIENQERCKDLNLNSASFLLQDVLGKASSAVFGVALLASGQSSTITGTYAGQYVMQGFLNLKMKLWLRNLVTRLVAILPSLIVALIGGSAAAGKLIIISSIILSIELPFALLPLLKFTSSPLKMGPYANSRAIKFLTWIIGIFVIVINVYFVSTAFTEWLIKGGMGIGGRVVIGMVGFGGILVYLAMIIYLALRAERETTYLAEYS